MTCKRLFLLTTITYPQAHMIGKGRQVKLYTHAPPLLRLLLHCMSTNLAITHIKSTNQANYRMSNPTMIPLATWYYYVQKPGEIPATKRDLHLNNPYPTSDSPSSKKQNKILTLYSTPNTYLPWTFQSLSQKYTLNVQNLPTPIHKLMIILEPIQLLITRSTPTQPDPP